MPGAIAEIVGAKSFQLAIGEPLIAVIIASLNFCLRRDRPTIWLVALEYDRSPKAREFPQLG
jgi:hypothetical protein